jgi:hypothetical protein
MRESGGYKIVAGYGQYHTSVLARRLNPPAGETIPLRSSWNPKIKSPFWRNSKY